MRWSLVSLFGCSLLRRFGRFRFFFCFFPRRFLRFVVSASRVQRAARSGPCGLLLIQPRKTSTGFLSLLLPFLSRWHADSWRHRLHRRLRRRRTPARRPGRQWQQAAILLSRRRRRRWWWGGILGRRCGRHLGNTGVRVLLHAIQKEHRALEAGYAAPAEKEIHEDGTFADGCST